MQVDLLNLQGSGPTINAKCTFVPLSCFYLLLVCLCTLYICSDYLFKLVLFGNSGVGKAYLLLWFMVSHCLFASHVH